MLAVDLLTAVAKNKMVFKVPWGEGVVAGSVMQMLTGLMLIYNHSDLVIVTYNHSDSDLQW